ncbi:hypothetical protein HDV06_001295 [Boothiomyces sp. JEL0866]|nr:hypothetical protein HDV06_001295 [Boothiomyces sp. JEL0866]
MNTLDLIEETITLDQLMEDEFLQEKESHLESENKDQPGYYVAIGDYYHTNQLKVSLGDVVTVTSVNNGYCYGINQNTNEQGLLPLEILVQLSDQVFQPQDLFEEESEGELISMNELNSLSLDYTTHCLETENETSIYFAWRYGGESVSVWGSFNDWQRPIQLFYDSVTTIFVCFTETTQRHGDLCFFKFVVDDQYQVDHTLPTITNEEGTFNYIVICTQYCQGKEHLVDIQNVQKIISNKSITEYDYAKEIQFENISNVAVESVVSNELEVVNVKPVVSSDLESAFVVLEPIPEYLAEELRLNAESKEAIRLQEIELHNQIELERLRAELEMERCISEENEKAITETVEQVPEDLSKEISIEAENQEAVRLQEMEIEQDCKSLIDLDVDEELIEPIPFDLGEEIRIAAENIEALRLQELEVQSTLDLIQQKKDLNLEMLVSKENENIMYGLIEDTPQIIVQAMQIEAENQEAIRLQMIDVQLKVESEIVKSGSDLEYGIARENQQTASDTLLSIPEDLLDSLRVEAENQEAVKLQQLEILAQEELQQLKKDLLLESQVSEENEKAISQVLDSIPSEISLQMQLEAEKLQSQDIALESKDELKVNHKKSDLPDYFPVELAEEIRIDAENQEAVKLQHNELLAEQKLAELKKDLDLEMHLTKENELAINFAFKEIAENDDKEIIQAAEAAEALPNHDIFKTSPVSEMTSLPASFAEKLRVLAENREAVKLQEQDLQNDINEMVDEMPKSALWDFQLNEENVELQMPEILAEELGKNAEDLEALKLQALEIQAEEQLEQLKQTLEIETFVSKENEKAINVVEKVELIPLDLANEIRIKAENVEAMKLQNLEIAAKEELLKLRNRLEVEMLVSQENELAIAEVIVQENLEEKLWIDVERDGMLKPDDYQAQPVAAEIHENDLEQEVKARDIAAMQPSGFIDPDLVRKIKIQVENKAALKLELSSGEENTSDSESQDGFEISHVNANMYSTTSEYMPESNEILETVDTSKRSSAVARQELVDHFHHTELEFESELADLSKLAKGSHQYNEQFIDALKHEASKFAENLYRLDALLGSICLTIEDIDSPYKTAFSYKLEKEIFGESLEEMLPEHIMFMEMIRAENEQEQTLNKQTDKSTESDLHGDALEEILSEEEKELQLEDREEMKSIPIEISRDIEKLVFGQKIDDFLPDNLLAQEKILFEDSVVAPNKSPSPSISATRGILKEFSRPMPEQIAISKKESRDDFDFSTGTSEEDDRLSYEEYTQHDQLEHHLDRISNILNLVKNPPKENYSNALPVDLIRSLQLVSEAKEETKIASLEEAENDLIDEIMDRFESPVEGTFSEWKFVTSVDHIEFHDEKSHEKHLSIQTDVTYSSGASSSDTVIDSPVFEKFTLKKSPNSPSTPSPIDGSANSLEQITEELAESHPAPYLPPTIPLPNIPATPSLIHSVPRNPSQQVFDSNRMSDLIDSLSKDEFPSSPQPQVQVPPSFRPKSRTTSKPYYVPSPLSFPPITRQETEENSSPEPSSPSNSTREVQVWEEIPLTPSPTLVTDSSTSMFSPVIDKYISVALAVACIANIKLLLSILSASWMVIRIFHMVWTFAGLVFLFGHLL